MAKAILNLNITCKHELDAIIDQYENGGRALSAIEDYSQELRKIYKYGQEEYFAEIQKLIKTEEDKEIDKETLSRVAYTTLMYFREKFFRALKDNDVKNW